MLNTTAPHGDRNAAVSSRTDPLGGHLVAVIVIGIVFFFAVIAALRLLGRRRGDVRNTPAVVASPFPQRIYALTSRPENALVMSAGVSSRLFMPYNSGMDRHASMWSDDSEPSPPRTPSALEIMDQHLFNGAASHHAYRGGRDAGDAV